MTAHMNEMQRQHQSTYNIIHYKGLLLTPALFVDATNYNTRCVRRQCTWIVSQILSRITIPSGSFAKRYKHPKANKLAPQLKLIVIPCFGRTLIFSWIYLCDAFQTKITSTNLHSTHKQTNKHVRCFASTPIEYLCVSVVHRSPTKPVYCCLV